MTTVEALAPALASGSADQATGRGMRLTIVAMEVPYPANHGGRVDVWRRLKALKRLDVPVQLICWSPGPLTGEVEAAIRANTSDFICLDYPAGTSGRLRRAFDLLSYPLGVTSRIVREPAFAGIHAAVKAFAPDVIMADHVHCATLADDLAERLGRPFVIRSHDIEHLHYRELMRSARTLEGKFLNYLEQRNLEHYEKRAFSKCLAFFDISSADLARWRDLGFTNGFLLSPLIDAEAAPSEDPPVGREACTFDAVFLGNLYAENNVSGVLWFVDEVLPRILKSQPDFRVAIAGSRPVSQITEKCAGQPNIQLMPNPPDAAAVYRSGRVCIDPVAVGLGVSIKALDMLAAQRPIVSFEKGTAGLPQSVKKYFRVAGNADEFAAAVLAAIDAEFEPISHAELRRELGDGAIVRFLDQLSGLLATWETERRAVA